MIDLVTNGENTSRRNELANGYQGISVIGWSVCVCVCVWKSREKSPEKSSGNSFIMSFFSGTFKWILKKEKRKKNRWISSCRCHQGTVVDERPETGVSLSSLIYSHKQPRQSSNWLANDGGESSDHKLNHLLDKDTNLQVKWSRLNEWKLPMKRHLKMSLKGAMYPRQR